MSENNNVLSFSKKKNNRRKALKEFYKLQEQNKKELENLNSNQAAKVPVHEANDSSSTIKDEELTLKNFDEYVRRQDFKTLISKENRITEELNANQGEIKSIIYNNYYELIKISNYLENLKNGAGSGSKARDAKEDIVRSVDEEDDTNEFTVGVDDEDENQDQTLEILNKIRANIAGLKSQDLYI